MLCSRRVDDELDDGMVVDQWANIMIVSQRTMVDVYIDDLKVRDPHNMDYIPTLWP